MRMIKFSHACVRLEKDGAVLVIDPGSFTEPESVEGADAIVITHGHPDHLDPAKITAAAEAKAGLVVLAPADAAADVSDPGVTLITVGPGERHDVVGFDVRTFGGEHATIVEGFAVPTNVGYLVDGSIYYPGDSFVVPDVEVETLLAPASAPWLKIAETIDFIRAIKPAHVHPTHDAILTDAGRAMVDAWFERAGGAEFSRLPIGAPVER